MTRQGGLVDNRTRTTRVLRDRGGERAATRAGAASTLACGSGPAIVFTATTASGGLGSGEAIALLASTTSTCENEHKRETSRECENNMKEWEGETQNREPSER